MLINIRELVTLFPYPYTVATKSFAR